MARVCPEVKATLQPKTQYKHALNCIVNEHTVKTRAK